MLKYVDGNIRKTSKAPYSQETATRTHKIPQPVTGAGQQAAGGRCPNGDR